MRLGEIEGGRNGSLLACWCLGSGLIGGEATGLGRRRRPAAGRRETEERRENAECREGESETGWLRGWVLTDVDVLWLQRGPVPPLGSSDLRIHGAVPRSAGAQQATVKFAL